MFYKKTFFCLAISLLHITCFSQAFTEVTTNLPNVSGGYASFGDYDNDGDLDICIIGYDGTSKISRIYQNNGGVFSYMTGIIFPGINWGTAEWIDYDSDGDLDLMFSGANNSYESSTYLYKNNGGNSFIEQPQPFENSAKSIAWGDYNNDGYRDVLIQGDTKTVLYRNKGDGSFIEQTGIKLPRLTSSSISWADIDNDGDLDISITGVSGGYNGTFVFKIYINKGDNTFEELADNIFTPLRSGSTYWIDYDNDGDLDVLLSGETKTGSVTKLYRDDLAQNKFTEITDVPFSMLPSSAAWADYDNDGDLDVMIHGKLYNNNSGNFTEVFTFPDWYGIWGDYDNDQDLDLLIIGSTTHLFRNNITLKNEKPSSPANLINIVNGNSVNLSWGESSDSKTPQPGLTYNLYVQQSPSGNYVASPNAGVPSGGRRLVKPGEILNPFYFLKNLTPGTYNWSVQAIDAGYTGSAFPAQGSFSIVFGNSISPAVNQILTPGSAGTTLSVSETLPADSRQWKYSRTPGGPYNRIIAGQTGTSYTPTIIADSSMYVVCASTKNGASVISNEVLVEVFPFIRQVSLPGVSHGSSDWGDYDNDGDMDLLDCGINTAGTRVSTIFRNDGNGVFVEQTGIALTGVSYSSCDWVDFNNDGYLDIFITGQDASGVPVAKIYRNNGNTFSEQPGTGIAGVWYSSTDWSDCDNDGDMDLLITGRNSAGIRVSKIYKNNLDNTFSELTVALTPVEFGDCSWSDYDLDKDPDILLTGYTGSASVSIIYKNNGDNTFSEQTSIVIAGVYYSSVAWCDYNSDGYPDFLISGSCTASSSRITKLYKNNRSSGFIEQTAISLTGVYMGSVAWGDYDNDGDPDILLSGYNMSGVPVSEIYRNDELDHFKLLSCSELYGIYRGTLTWVDYDNDRDLDIFLTGYASGIRTAKIFRNNSHTSNSAPGSPSNLSITSDGTYITFSWDGSGNTDETPANGLSYNIRIGSGPGLSNVMSANSDAITGFHRLPEYGNVGHAFYWKLKKTLPPGNYYWSVQAIDHGFTGSAFAPEQTFSTLFSVSTLTYSGSSWSHPGDYDNDGDADILTVKNGITIYRNDISIGQGLVEISTGLYASGADGYLEWGDIDNDNDLDIGYIGPQNNRTAVIYRNDNGTFTKAAEIPGACMGKFEWQDFDNDGDIDMFIYGNNESSDDGEPIGLLYRNNGSGTFTNAGIDVGEFRRGAIAFGDIEGDGYADILLAGYNLSQNVFSSLLRNNNGVDFTKLNSSIEEYAGGDQSWGDMDSDGDLDIVITGGLLSSGSEGDTRIYSNAGNGVFSDTGNRLPMGYGVYNTSLKLGDFDNDGDLDIITDDNIFRNDGSNTFTPYITGMKFRSPVWCDIDNDNDLDIIAQGKILINNTIVKNSAPTQPNNLSSKVSLSKVVLSWTKGSDNQTPTDGLTYNVCVGTTAGQWNILSPVSTGPGKMMQGNAMTNKFKIITGLKPGVYYWTVQSVDNGYKASAFAPVQSFEVFPMFNLINPAVSGTIWGDYDNDGDLDILGGNGVSQNNGAGAFTSFQNSAEGFYWADLDNDGDLDIITSSSVLKNNGNNIFTDLNLNLALTDQVADYDSDGDLDILTSDGIYLNDKSIHFVKLPLSFTGAKYWLDSDNDGDLDIISITGSYPDYQSHFYRNDGLNVFTELNTGFANLMCAISTSDYDNDNDLDILMVGVGSEYRYWTKLYKNNGGNVFEDVNVDIRGYNIGRSFWGDFNHDRLPDFIHSGWNNGRTRNELYENLGNDKFIEKDINNIVEYIDVYSFGDYDKDGDLDALTQGWQNPGGIYRNNTNPESDPIPLITGLGSDLKGLNSLLFWERPLKPGYSFNIRIGTSPGAYDIKSPFGPPGPGNVPCNTSWLIKNLTPGTYYWSVQAVDLNYNKGPWAAEKSFLITNVSPDFSSNTVCYGEPTIFTDLSQTSNKIVRWKWSFDDGSFSEASNPVHLYTMAGTFNVSLWAYSESGDSAVRTRDVIVKPAPDASFSVAPVCKDQPSILENHSTVNNITITSWTWNFGNGELSHEQGSVQKTYVRSDTATLKIVASNGCWDADTQKVVVAEYPDASMFLSPGYDNVFCKGDSTILLVQENSDFDYQWKLNDIAISGATKSSLVVKGQGGEYAVSIANPVARCISSSSAIVTVYESPTSPVIQYDSGYNLLCKGDSVILSAALNPDYEYEWRVNGGVIKTGSNVLSARNTGKYDVIVRNSKGCPASALNPVDLLFNETPSVSDVSLSGGTDLCDGQNVLLRVTASENCTLQWKNERGIIDGENKSSYVAASTGTYLMEASNSSGCRVRTLPVNVTVRKSPIKQILSSANYEDGKCPGDNVITISTTNPGSEYQYQWLKDGVPVQEQTSQSMEILERGKYKLRAEINGCFSESDVLAINIPEGPDKPVIFYEGPTIWYLACNNVDADYYRWYHNGNLIQGADKYYYAANYKLGSYQVSVGNDKGCFTRSDVVTIPPGLTDIDDSKTFGNPVIFPNPGQGLFTIEMDNMITGEIILRVVSPDGKRIVNRKIEKVTEHYVFELDLTGQAEGFYFLQLVSGKSSYISKIVIK